MLSYPGISGTRFNPIEAQRVWGECLKKEKEGRYVHSYLDAHHKLELDEKWANDVSRGDGLMPDYESLDEVYNRLGWKVLANGRVIAPDPAKIVNRHRRKSRQRKTHPESASTSGGLIRGVSDATLTATDKMNPDHLPTRQLAPSLRGKKDNLSKAKHKVHAATSGHRRSDQAPSASRRESSMPGAVPVVRAKPLRAGQQDAPSAPVRGARHMVRPETAFVHAVLRKSASAPGINTAKRAVARDASRFKS